MRLAQRKALVLLIVLFSLAPVLGAIMVTVSAKRQDAEIALDARLAEISRASVFELKSDMERFRQILLISAQNPALINILQDPTHRQAWKQDVDRSLLQLTTIFPGMIDEACRVDPAGAELGRVVQGSVSLDNDLSPDESANPFFRPTTGLPQGGVHYQEPYISPDTKRWVISVSTPLYAGGKNYGILHFEVPLSYYYQTLNSIIPRDGFLAVVSPSGKIYFSSGAGEPADQPFPELGTISRDPGLSSAAPQIIQGDSGFAGWSIGPTTYRMHYETVEVAPGLRTALLVGLPAVPSLASEFIPYTLPLALLVLVVVVAAYIMSSRLAGAHEDKPQPTGARGPTRGKAYVWTVVATAVTVAGCGAYAINRVHSNVNTAYDAEVLLVRLEGSSRWLHALKGIAATTEVSRQAQEVQARITADMSRLALMDGQGPVSAHAAVALGQYGTDIEQLDKLYADGRDAEARIWSAERLSRSYATLLGSFEDGRSVYHEAGRRANLVADAGSASTLMLGALLMGLLFWRAEQARRTAQAQGAEEEAVRKSAKRFSALVQNTADLISILEADGTVRYQSPSAKQVLGYDAEGIIGSSVFALLHDDYVITAQQLLAETLKKPGVNVVSELRAQHKDGSWLYLETIGNNLLNDPNVNGILLNSRDVTERKRLADQLEHQAFHDSLTGLPNRSLFQDRLKHALARAGTDTGFAPSVAVLFLDLDGFKVINDSLGHKIGDMLLTAVGERLGECVRASDTIARLGGDEFTVILEDIAGEGDAVEAAERITERMRSPFYIEGQEIFVSSSIGISLGALKDDRVTDFLRSADIAMYEAKGKGRGNYQLYDPEMNLRICQRLEMENDLRRALEREEFRVYYQPIVHLGTGKIIEVEALVRWQHPTKGLVPPLDFIPLAEETGLILPIGQWIMEEACKKVKTWHAQCLTDPPLILSVNLSAKQFSQQNLIEQIMCTLQETGLDPHFLKLEITETVALEDVDVTITMLQELKTLGIQVAIDDFGMGYSALSYLKRFPADTLKLDKTFIDGLGRDPEDTAIVHAVIEVAKALNLKVTAEGIETAEHLERLRGLDCDQGQGYYFAKPISAEAITALLASRLHWNKVEAGKVQKAKGETKPLERVGV